MKNILIVMAFFLLVPMVVACDGSNAPEKASAQEEGFVKNLSIMSHDGKMHDFMVELALTPEQQMQGLMYRTELAKNKGMLFIFGQEQEGISFYMKNTLIPLDMLFIKRDGTIHHIHKNAVPNDLTSIPSQGPTYAVLEVIGGLTSELGIVEGDKAFGAFFVKTP